MIKRLERLRKKLKELDTYDRIYWDGKLYSLLMVILCFIVIICIFILCMFF